MEDVYLKRCLETIEQRLGWGSSAAWTNADFEKLSEKIFEQTQTNLSTATLKRIWGKVKYENAPTVTTLNTLAQFIGHDSWRSFVNANSAPEKIRQTNGIETQPRRARYVAVAIAVVVGLLSVSGFYFVSLDETTLRVDPTEYKFTSEKMVTTGVPNSVVFQYDASAAPTDSVYIQQSWDGRLSKKVSRDGKFHTAIYYEPGMFKAKLIVGKQIVKEHKIFITTDGWMALIDQEPTPYYIAKKDFEQAGQMAVSVDVLKNAGIPFQPQAPWVSYGIVQDYDTLNTGNFVLEARMKNNFPEGNSPCQHMRVLVLVEGAMPLVIPLTKKGCISDLELLFADKVVDGKTNDLSMLGCEVGKWVDFRCEVVDGLGKIFVNGEQAHEARFETRRKILGVVFQFQGTGSVDYVRLGRNSNGWFINDDFNITSGSTAQLQ